MAEPLHVPESPPVDPSAVRKAYRRERAKRRARRDRIREQRLAGFRFMVVLFALLALSVFLTLTAWHEVQRLFGL
ncbi:MAG: hypothetical protein WD689_05345 [Gaiellaceae bacterium]